MKVVKNINFKFYYMLFQSHVAAIQAAVTHNIVSIQIPPIKLVIIFRDYKKIKSATFIG